MALKQNTSLLAQLPLRQIGGSPGTFRSMWGRGDRMNQSVGEGIPSELAGIPSGHLAPSAWVLPYRGGAMSAFTFQAATVSLGTLNVAAGRNIEGDTSITVTVPDALLQLVVSAVGSASITFTADGTLAGALAAEGAANISVTVPTATLGAIIDAIAAAQITVSASANIRATGALAGDITPFTELSPQSLADAVWSSLSSEYQTAGTMGELLNSAGAAADPLLGVVEDSLTLRDVMRILLAVAGGDATGLEGGTMVFKAQDGSTIRVQADYSSGDRTITTLDPS